MEIKTDTLESLCELIVDCPHSTPKWTDEGIVVLRNQYIRNGTLDLSDPSFTNEEDYQKRIKRAVPQVGDIVFTREAPMGEVCLIPEGLKCCLGQRQVLLRPRKDISGEYLFWALQSPYVQHQISWNEGTGTTVSNVRIPVLKALKIPRHPQDEAQAAGILSALASKIQLNRQTNQTLENMAQALFKSWFVDFDPVIDNALAAGNTIPEPLQERAEQRKALRGIRHSREGGNPPRTVDPRLRGDDGKEFGDGGITPLPESLRQLFPSGFVFDAEMGWIPEGWEVAAFNNIASHVRANIKPENINDNDIYVGLEHIGRKQIFLSDHGMGEEVESNKSGFKQNDLLFGKLRPYFHKVCLAPKVGICSTDILVFRAKEKYFHSFMALTAYTESFVEYANLRSTGTRMPRASAKDMLAYQLVLPPKNLAEVFEKTIQPMWDKGFSSVVSNDELAKLRDTLLPKLISGELRLPTEASETQQQTKAAVV